MSYPAVHAEFKPLPLPPLYHSLLKKHEAAMTPPKANPVFHLPEVAQVVSNATVKRIALDWVNAVNASLGRDPIPALVPGLKNRSCQCPIANSIPDAESANSGLALRRNGTLMHFDLPKLVHEFVTRFDDGRYPELVLAAA